MKKRFEIGKKVIMSFPAVIKTVDAENFSLEAVFSSQKEDRHGDVVMQDGWDMKMFKKNPVILNSHNYDDATEVIGRATNVKIVDKELHGKITFAVKENPKAKIIFDLYAGGFLNAFSVGFIPKKFKEDDYFTIEESELLEVSAVSVPANAWALAKSKGIDVESLVAEAEEKDALKGELGDEEEAEAPEIDPVAEETPAIEETPAPVIETEPEAEIEAPEPTPEPEIVPAPEPKVASINTMVLKAINSIDNEQVLALKKAHAIIGKMLRGEDIPSKLSTETKAKVRTRQYNQVIRSLIKAK